MSQVVENVEDGQGRSVGCILMVGAAVIAVTPSGARRECENRKSAIWWLRETAAGRDPERGAKRPHPIEIGLLVILGCALALFAFMFIKDLITKT
jgi:hypothetical protein